MSSIVLWAFDSYDRLHVKSVPEEAGKRAAHFQVLPGIRARATAGRWLPDRGVQVAPGEHEPTPEQKMRLAAWLFDRGFGTAAERRDWRERGWV